MTGHAILETENFRKFSTMSHFFNFYLDNFYPDSSSQSSTPAVTLTQPGTMPETPPSTDPTVGTTEKLSMFYH